MEYLHTYDWCMMPLNVTGVLGEWLENRPLCHTGNTEDGRNILLTVTPDQATLNEAPRIVDLRTAQLTDERPSEQLVKAIGNALVQSGDVVIIGDRGQFQIAHATPHWKLWCAPEIYDSDDDEEFQQQLLLLQLPPSTTRQQSREIIRQQVS